MSTYKHSGNPEGIIGSICLFIWVFIRFSKIGLEVTELDFGGNRLDFSLKYREIDDLCVNYDK